MQKTVDFSLFAKYSHGTTSNTRSAPPPTDGRDSQSGSTPIDGTSGIAVFNNLPDESLPVMSVRCVALPTKSTSSSVGQAATFLDRDNEEEIKLEKSVT